MKKLGKILLFLFATALVFGALTFATSAAGNEAEFGGTSYSTLSAAVSAANTAGSGTVKLLTDVALAETVTLNPGVCLDINGKTVTSSVSPLFITTSKTTVIYSSASGAKINAAGQIVVGGAAPTVTFGDGTQNLTITASEFCGTAGDKRQAVNADVKGCTLVFSGTIDGNYYACGMFFASRGYAGSVAVTATDTVFTMQKSASKEHGVLVSGKDGALAATFTRCTFGGTIGTNMATGHSSSGNGATTVNVTLTDCKVGSAWTLSASSVNAENIHINLADGTVFNNQGSAVLADGCTFVSAKNTDYAYRVASNANAKTITWVPKVGETVIEKWAVGDIPSRDNAVVSDETCVWTPEVTAVTTDATYTEKLPSEISNAAAIGAVEYKTLAEALAAAALLLDEPTVKLLDDVVVTETLTLPEILLDLNGHTVTGTAATFFTATSKNTVIFSSKAGAVIDATSKTLFASGVAVTLGDGNVSFTVKTTTFVSGAYNVALNGITYETVGTLAKAYPVGNFVSKIGDTQTLTATGVTFLLNQANGGGEPGFIANQFGTVQATFTNCTFGGTKSVSIFAGHYGSGKYGGTFIASLVGCTVSDNLSLTGGNAATFTVTLGAGCKTNNMGSATVASGAAVAKDSSSSYTYNIFATADTAVVTWKDANGAVVLANDRYKKGEIPVYTGEALADVTVGGKSCKQSFPAVGALTADITVRAVAKVPVSALVSLSVAKDITVYVYLPNDVIGTDWKSSYKTSTQTVKGKEYTRVALSVDPAEAYLPVTVNFTMADGTANSFSCTVLDYLVNLLAIDATTDLQVAEHRLAVYLAKYVYEAAAYERSAKGASYSIDEARFAKFFARYVTNDTKGLGVTFRDELPAASGVSATANLYGASLILGSCPTYRFYTNASTLSCDLTLAYETLTGYRLATVTSADLAYDNTVGRYYFDVTLAAFNMSSGITVIDGTSALTYDLSQYREGVLAENPSANLDFTLALYDYSKAAFAFYDLENYDASAAHIHYVLNGGVFAEEVVTALTAGTEVTLPTAVVRNRATFAGWYTSPTFAANTRVTKVTLTGETLNLYAKWDYTLLSEDFESMALSSSGGKVGSFSFATGKTGTTYSLTTAGGNRYLVWNKGASDPQIDAYGNFKNVGGNTAFTFTVDLAKVSGKSMIASNFYLRESSSARVSVFQTKAGEDKVYFGGEAIADLSTSFTTFAFTVDFEKGTIRAYVGGTFVKEITFSAPSGTTAEWQKELAVLFNWYASGTATGAIAIDNVAITSADLTQTGGEELPIFDM